MKEARFFVAETESLTGLGEVFNLEQTYRRKPPRIDGGSDGSLGLASVHWLHLRLQMITVSPVLLKISLKSKAGASEDRCAEC